MSRLDNTIDKRSIIILILLLYLQHTCTPLYASQKNAFTSLLLSEVRDACSVKQTNPLSNFIQHPLQNLITMSTWFCCYPASPPLDLPKLQTAAALTNQIRLGLRGCIWQKINASICNATKHLGTQPWHTAKLVYTLSPAHLARPRVRLHQLTVPYSFAGLGRQAPLRGGGYALCQLVIETTRRGEVLELSNENRGWKNPGPCCSCATRRMGTPFFDLQETEVHMGAVG